jgi:hypothetical protein
LIHDFVLINLLRCSLISVTCVSTETFNASEAFLSGNMHSDISSLVNLGTFDPVGLFCSSRKRFSYAALHCVETLDLGSLQSFLGQYPKELFALPKLRKSPFLRFVSNIALSYPHASFLFVFSIEVSCTFLILRRDAAFLPTSV